MRCAAHVSKGAQSRDRVSLRKQKSWRPRLRPATDGIRRATRRAKRNEGNFCALDAGIFVFSAKRQLPGIHAGDSATRAPRAIRSEWAEFKSVDQTRLRNAR